MVATTAGAYERFEIGRVIERIFMVFKRNPVPLLLAGLLLSALPRAIYSLLLLTQFQGMLVPNLATNPAAMFARMFSPITLLGTIVTVAGAILLQPALLFGVVSDCAGGKPTLAQMMRVAVRTALPVLAVGIIAYIATFIGLILLIVPGIIVALMLCVAAPARVAEGEGVMRALSRSAELTRGCRWGILGFFVIYFILATLFGWAVGLVSLLFHLGSGAASALAGGVGAMMWSQWPSMLVIGPIVQALQVTVGAAAVASVYFELRHVKDGVSAEALAQAFD